MSDDSSSAPAWLFSFVDLAFLLLIAMTQIADPNAPELGEIIVPRLDEEASSDIAPSASQVWQVRVHPRLEGELPAFELRSVGGDSGPESRRLELESLKSELATLHEVGASKPLLAPHSESRSQDLLDAVAAIEEHWSGRRRALVSRLAAAP